MGVRFPFHTKMSSYIFFFSVSPYELTKASSQRFCADRECISIAQSQSELGGLFKKSYSTTSQAIDVCTHSQGSPDKSQKILSECFPSLKWESASLSTPR